jgi:hypothetical protein
MTRHEETSVIYTDHALERMKLRRITQGMIASAVKSPDKREHEADGDTRVIKTIQGRNVQVVSTWLDDERKWLVKSAWVRGEDDPTPIWKRVLLLPLRLIQQLFGNKRKSGRRR